MYKVAASGFAGEEQLGSVRSDWMLVRSDDTVVQGLQASAAGSAKRAHIPLRTAGRRGTLRWQVLATSNAKLVSREEHAP